jgi:acyl-coenzyme A thioesterase PaaI-like protein
MSGLERGAEEILSFVVAGFSELRREDLDILSLEAESLVYRLVPGPSHLRPGGTLSGPTLVTVADLGLYLLLLARGAPPGCVTSTLTAHFLRRPAPCAVIARVRLLKQSRRTAVGEVSLYSEGDEAGGPIAHVSLAYAIPAQA